ncbi:MAG TPA: ImmA/IrrE family metallo-endopeptidase [Planctomycetota bacterium]|nr:ImmA/IrrE family metallo-endopeptidase [Planctomycetota bacterium]
MDEFPIAYLSYEHLRERAAAFLAQHHPSGTIPVPIEEIAEAKLGLDIVPVPGLQDALRSDDYGVVGFLTSDLKEIHVDEWIWKHRYNRYRFTIAHEIGHLILHRELYESRRFDSIHTWKMFINSIPDEVHGWYEWQAYAFAGLVLVPGKPLRTAVTNHLARVADRLKQENIPIAAVRDTVWDIVIDLVAKQFEVSADVIQRRVEKDSLSEELLPG